MFENPRSQGLGFSLLRCRCQKRSSKDICLCQNHFMLRHPVSLSVFHHVLELTAKTDLNKRTPTQKQTNLQYFIQNKWVCQKTWNPPKPSKMVSTLLVNPDSIPFSLDTLNQSTTHTRTHSSFGAKSTERQRQFLQRAGHIALQQHKVFLQDATRMVADVWILQILRQDRREDLECSKFDPNN